MVHWDTTQGKMMRDSIEDALNDLIDECATNLSFCAEEFEQVLAEYGFMIVPIEDPTNLRFGVED